MSTIEEIERDEQYKILKVVNDFNMCPYRREISGDLKAIRILIEKETQIGNTADEHISEGLENMKQQNDKEFESVRADISRIDGKISDVDTKVDKIQKSISDIGGKFLKWFLVVFIGGVIVFTANNLIRKYINESTLFEKPSVEYIIETEPNA